MIWRAGADGTAFTSKPGPNSAANAPWDSEGPPMSPVSFARIHVHALAIAGAILSVAVTAGAQDAGKAAAQPAAPQGIVNTVAYQPIPEKATLAVRPLDNSDANLKIKAAIEDALRARGFGVAQTAPLTLNFSTRDEIGAWSETGRRTLLELKAEGGREGGEYAHAKVNIFDSATGGLLNQGHGGTTITTPSSYRIDATLDDKTSGRRLWQGWTIANLSHGERAELDRAMVPVIVQNLGRTISRQPFNLQ